MNDIDFLSMMKSEPDNEVHRLVYADWLESQGRPECQFVRSPEVSIFTKDPNAIFGLSDFKDDYDWKQVLSYAGKDECYQTSKPPERALPTSTVDCSPFGMDDVAVVLKSTLGENDESDWRCAVLLYDGRFAYIEAGCDYTGWDCRAGGSATVASSWDELIRWGLTDDARSMFGVKVDFHANTES